MGMFCFLTKLTTNLPMQYPNKAKCLCTHYILWKPYTMFISVPLSWWDMFFDAKRLSSSRAIYCSDINYLYCQIIDKPSPILPLLSGRRCSLLYCWLTAPPCNSWALHLLTTLEASGPPTAHQHQDWQPFLPAQLAGIKACFQLPKAGRGGWGRGKGNGEESAKELGN